MSDLIKTNEFANGCDDCGSGEQCSMNRSQEYLSGYSYQYQKEQNATANTDQGLMEENHGH